MTKKEFLLFKNDLDRVAIQIRGKGLTLEELAKLVGYEHQTVRAWTSLSRSIPDVIKEIQKGFNHMNDRDKINYVKKVI